MHLKLYCASKNTQEGGGQAGAEATWQCWPVAEPLELRARVRMRVCLYIDMDVSVCVSGPLTQT